MLKKYLIILGAIVFLALASTSAYAVSDDTDDLFHALGDGNYETYSNEKEDIDITDVSYSTSETQVTVTLTVDGEIQDGNLFGYFVYIATEGIDGFDYFASYTSGIGYVFDNTLAEHLVTKNSNTLTFVFDVDNPSNITKAWGYTYELATYGSEELWLDYAPDTYFPAYSQFYEDDTNGESPDEENPEDAGTGETNTSGSENGGEDDNNTPGFGIILLIAAISISIIFIKRKK